MEVAQKLGDVPNHILMQRKILATDDAQGFAAVTMLPTEVCIDLYNISGQVMYLMNLQKI